MQSFDTYTIEGVPAGCFKHTDGSVVSKKMACKIMQNVISAIIGRKLSDEAFAIIEVNNRVYFHIECNTLEAYKIFHDLTVYSNYYVKKVVTNIGDSYQIEILTELVQ